jgi:PilZ domain
MSTSPLSPEHNRRVVPRKALRQAATVVLGDATREARTFDLGRDGMCLLSPKPIAPGTRCKVTFDVPFADGPVNVTVSAKVVYSSYAAIGEFKIGVAFTELDEATSLVLGKFAA